MDTNVLGKYASYIFRVKVEYGEDVVRLSVGKVDHRREERRQNPAWARTTYEDII
jgi:hypothetical protein